MLKGSEGDSQVTHIESGRILELYDGIFLRAARVILTFAMFLVNAPALVVLQLGREQACVLEGDCPSQTNFGR